MNPFYNSSSNYRRWIICFFVFFAIYLMYSFYNTDFQNRCIYHLKSLHFESEGDIRLNVAVLNVNLVLKRLKRTSRKIECDDYEMVRVYPSVFGFESCDVYLIGDELTGEKAILCNSSSTIDTVLFINDSKFGLLECVKSKESKVSTDARYACYPRTKTSTVCGCNAVCDENSVANNLPVTRRTKSRKVFAFSLYGNHSDYYCGALRQIRLAKIFFPEWTARVYVNSSVPSNAVEMIEKEAEVLYVPEDSPFIESGMFWRFFIADDEDIDAYCVRDTDSVFSFRESLAVKQWLDSGKGFYSLRDHPYHAIHILGGLWCGKKRIRGIKQLMLKHKHRDKKQDDQHFLTGEIWPKVNDDIFIHDSFPSWHPDRSLIHPFPIDRMGCEYIGVALRSEYDVTIANRLLVN